MDNETEVKLIATLQGIVDTEEMLDPDNLPVYATRGCSSEQTLLELLDSDLDKEIGKRMKGIEKTYRESSGRGHGAVLDMSSFVFQIANLPRITTLHLCLPQYLEHMQQSLRWSTASRGFCLPKSIEESVMGNETAERLEASFELYDQMIDDTGIPKEDARFILPLYTLTNITTKGNARELMHLHHMSDQPGVPSTTRDIVNEMIRLATGEAPRLMKRRANNYEPLAWMPSAQLFAERNETMDELVRALIQGNRFNRTEDTVDLLGHSSINMNADAIKYAVEERAEPEMANLKHMHFTFMAPMSLAALHQAIRQRTWDQSVETIYSAADYEDIVIPPKIDRKKEWKDKYEGLAENMFRLYKALIKSGVSKEDAIGVIPHGLKVYDLIHVNGWNAIHSIGKRTCTKAQWEIRGVATQMAKHIEIVNPALGAYAKPQGITYGRCPEKRPCKKCF